jgi:predicted nucleic acid-binding protein
VRFTIDCNILVYALDSGTPEKHRIASDLMIRAAMLDAVLTSQVLAEFLNVIRRKYPAHLDSALEQAKRWVTLFPVGATSAEHVLKGAAFAERYRLQLWDSIIWQVASDMHAAVFLSEDLQDGLSVDGMTVIDPFNPGNDERLAQLLGSSSQRD